MIETCPCCAAGYRRFRVGLTFAGVRRELRAEPDRRRVTRHTVLGRMHEYKLNHWHESHGAGRCVPEETP